MTDIVSAGVTAETLNSIGFLAISLLVLYLLRVLFRYLSSGLSHRAAWILVHDLRIRVYDHIQSFSIGYFHDKQTGDLMSRADLILVFENGRIAQRGTHEELIAQEGLYKRLCSMQEDSGFIDR